MVVVECEVDVVFGAGVVDCGVVVVGVEAQLSLTACTGPVTGSLIADNGVPGATFTVKLTFWPPTSVTVTTQVSAEATGIAAMPKIASSDPAVATATTSFRLLNTVALTPPAFAARWAGAATTRWHGKDATDC